MADKDLTIRLKLDKGDMKANADAAKADIREVEKAAEKAATAQEQGAKKASRARREAAKEAGQAEKQSFDESSKASDGFTAALVRVNVGQKALGAVADTARAIVGIMTDASQRTADLAREANKVRDELREIAGLKGVLGGVTDAFMRENAGFIRATGMTGAEAKTFRTAFTGAAALSAGVTIDKGAELNRFEQLSAQFAVTRNANASVLADLAGAGLRFKDYRGEGGGDRAVGDVAGIYDILGEGAGDTNVLADQYKNLAAGFVSRADAAGAFSTPQEAAAAITVAAEQNAGHSSIITQQALRAQRFLTGKFGLEWTDTFRSGQPKIHEAINQAIASGQAKTPEHWFELQGVNSEEARSASVFYNSRGLFASQMGVADAKAAADPGAAVATIEKAYATDLGILGRVADADLAASKVERGMETERASVLKRQVEARLFAEGKIDTAATDVGDWLSGVMINPFASDADKRSLGRQRRLNRAARERLEAGGVDVASAADRSLTGLPTTREAWELMSGESDRILDDGARRLEKLLEEQNAIMKAEAARKGPMPTVAPAPGGPSR